MFATTFLGFTISAIWLTFLFFVWILIAFWPATIAKSKGYSFWLFLLISIPFWWITLFVTLFLKDKSATPVVPPTTPSV